MQQEKISQNEKQKTEIEARIHITNENIFGDMSKLADKQFIIPEEEKLTWEELAEKVAKASKLAPQIAAATENAEKTTV